jgi:hypothetical protein
MAGDKGWGAEGGRFSDSTGPRVPGRGVLLLTG